MTRHAAITRRSTAASNDKTRCNNLKATAANKMTKHAALTRGSTASAMTRHAAIHAAITGRPTAAGNDKTRCNNQKAHCSR